MAHLCPDCNEECTCHDDTGRVVSLHMPVDCEHCALEDDDDVDDDEWEPRDDEGDALEFSRPGRRW